MPKLNPLLESDNIECAHNGNVLLHSSTKDIMCVQDSSGNDAGMISLQDLANATIVGCTNNIAGVPSPCTKLVNIPTSICSTLLEVDSQKIVLAQAISQVLTDKGSPLILQDEPKAKDIFELDEDIADFDNAQNGNENTESISESSPKSSNQSNADSNESNANKSNAKSSKDSQTKKEQMVLEVVRKWEYRGGGDTNANNWATISEFTLKKDDEIVKDSQDKDIKGYIIEPAGINLNPKHKVKVAGNEVVVGTLPPEQQQITSGSDTRIPAGEYNVFWRYSSKRTFIKQSNKSQKQGIENIVIQNLNKLLIDMNLQKLICNQNKCAYNKPKYIESWGQSHIHIMPELYNDNLMVGTIKNALRDNILIHNGLNGGWSDGCLIPTEQINRTNNPTRAMDEQSSTTAIARLYICMIMHDKEAFENYIYDKSHRAKSTISNFIVRIIEDKNGIRVYDK